MTMSKPAEAASHRRLINACTGLLARHIWRPLCGRDVFKQETTDLMKRFGESISFDWRLYRYDIRGLDRPRQRPR